MTLWAPSWPGSGDRAAVQRRGDQGSCDLIALHLRFHGYAASLGSGWGWTDQRFVGMSAMSGDQLARLHVLTRADVTTRDTAKAERRGGRTTIWSDGSRSWLRRRSWTRSDPISMEARSWKSWGS